MKERTKISVLLAFCICVSLALLWVPPLAQDPGYHSFSDQRSWLGISNFGNVISNLPFILIGVWGLRGLAKRRFWRHDISAAAQKHLLVFAVFFLGLVLTGFGSGYYHWSPQNHTLLWDRLPMTVTFMAFFCAICSLHIRPTFWRKYLLPCLGLGAASVLYWSYTEELGRGDLRFYALVQFLPMVLIPVIVLTFRTDRYRTYSVGLTIGVYVVAKILEHFDAEVYLAFGVSGHSLKHVTASLAGLSVAWLISSIRD